LAERFDRDRVVFQQVPSLCHHSFAREKFRFKVRKRGASPSMVPIIPINGRNQRPRVNDDGAP
jgi:hypothetical protein